MASRGPRALAWTSTSSTYRYRPNTRPFLVSCSSRASATTLATAPNQGPAHLNMMTEIPIRLSKSGRVPAISILEALRRHYPHCTVTQTPKSTGILKLAKAGRASATLDTANSNFYASRKYKPSKDGAPGRLKYTVDFGKYDYCWNDEYFQIYVADYWESEYSHVHLHWIVYPRKEDDIVNGQSQTVDKLIVAASKHIDHLNNEIWVYDRGYWRKNHKLWKSVQACSWDDVILNPDVKTQLIGDIEGFFDRQEEYKSFAVPWKRGIILHGLPGNGKTISIKALMRSLASRPRSIPTLYVKSLGKDCDQDDIRSIFEKARQTSPCLLVLEDIDSLVRESVRSFFLNEVDGLEGNDGIMMIGMDKLDAGISKRPSRFDRKYHFALPATAERIRYCEFWRSKLSKTSSIHIPNQAPALIAKITEDFSFAYLQEAFVATLLSIARTRDGATPPPDLSDGSVTKDSPLSAKSDFEASEFWQAMRKEVKTLRKEMQDSRKSVEDALKNSASSDAKSDSGGSSVGFGVGR
ncbi:MAG: hypothetical protein Q9211_000934 [Gyalolechia sp. 1 TL-2023]